MLTRKVFEAQAAIIKKHLPKVGREFSFEMASSIADYFAGENPRFDRTRFFEACGLGGLHLRALPVQYVDSDAMKKNG